VSTENGNPSGISIGIFFFFSISPATILLSDSVYGAATIVGF
jgi:hypothetical protein